MENLFIKSTEFCPEVLLSHTDKKFHLKGNSRPEDVRELYYPVVEWMQNYRDFITNKDYFSEEDPLIFEFDFGYFNSSSAKFLYDIVQELKAINDLGIPVNVAWFWEKEDVDMLEAGEDLALLAQMEFAYISK